MAQKNVATIPNEIPKEQINDRIESSAHSVNFLSNLNYSFYRFRENGMTYIERRKKLISSSGKTE